MSEYELRLHEIFEGQVGKTPNAIALQSGDLSLTYAELDQQANRLARRLLAVKRADRSFAAIYLNRSELPIIAIIACHKAGMTYVPIDPSYPADRIKHIVEELGIEVCLTESARVEPAVEYFDGVRHLIVIDAERGNLSKLSPHPLTRDECIVSPRDLAYIIYTSGTTGRPKGVMTEHGHACRYVRAFNTACGTGPQDRVYQGFSLSFDGSIEEIWMAFSNGSTLVVPTADAPRFGEELGQYLADLRITYFSTVPTMLSTFPTSMTPDLRTVVLSGEVCTADLVERQARPGLRIFNVYGPTEATVNTTVFECVPGRPITIGRPLPGYRLYVVDADLRPVPRGAQGELLIGSFTLARGYVARPDLTKATFVHTDTLGPNRVRVYRTGDLVRWNQYGEMEFFGRMDGQVKIRGYRVELAEIESVLREHPMIKEACVRLADREGMQRLAAYVVLEPGEFVRDEVLSLLESRVPPYMVPAYLDALPVLPRTTSGKVDRKTMPEPVDQLVRRNREMVVPTTGLERIVAQTWAEIFDMPEVSVEDDFFTDLGGHSLLAARTVTLLRERTNRSVAVREAYRYPTVRELAAYLETVPSQNGQVSVRKEIPLGPDGKPARPADYAAPARIRRFTWAAQLLSMYLLSAVLSVPLIVTLLFVLMWNNRTITISQMFGYTTMIGLCLWPFLLVFSIASKWILIGRYRPGTYELWGFFYLRWWLVQRLTGLSGLGAIAGTPLMPVYARLMGAKIGKGCTINSLQFSAWDLLTIGDDTSICADTQTLCYRVENGALTMGRATIGSRCFLGIHSAMGLNSSMADDCLLDDQSLVPDGVALPSGGFRGSPPEPADVPVPEPVRQSTGRRFRYGVYHFLASLLLGLAMGLPPFFGAVFVACFSIVNLGWIWGSVLFVCLVPVNVVITICYLAFWKRVIGKIKPGVHPVLSVAYLRKWLSDGMMGATRAMLLPLYTTLYLPPMLRLFGAKIGRRAELSTIWSFSPEFIDVGAESFFADGSIIGGRRHHRGAFEVGMNRIGTRSFVGNSAILPMGQSMGDNSLLGVQSITPLTPSTTPDGSEWLGSPSFRLTHRAKVGNFDDKVTFRPSWDLLLKRGIVDGLRVLIPYYSALVFGVAWLVTMYFTYLWRGVWAMVVVAPVAAFGYSVLAAATIALLKVVVMRRFKPEIKPLWSMYVWLNEMVNGCYESIVAPVASSLLGTPYAVFLMRMMGCRIGRGCYLGTTLFSEFDLVEVGDYACLNQGVVVQNHLFEDRVFKSSHLKIGAYASVGNMTVVLYDSEIEPGVVVGPLSLLMKGETLAAGTRWHGIPTQEVRPVLPRATRPAPVPDRPVRTRMDDAFGYRSRVRTLGSRYREVATM
jgi:non-ribosomal peptide synthetase-like protein